MTRHLFAFLALLSGLAAISQPVHAHLAEASAACDAGVEVSAESASAADHVEVKSASDKAAQRKAKQPQKRLAPSPASLRLPVLMGIERAYE